ncbi:MAG: type IV toxin-antitoxin system AbiEi family antitoxin domain-containing protein [bacterium]
MELLARESTGGISALNRQRLGLIHRAAKGPITVQEAAKALNLDQASTAKLLAHWRAQGWLVRIRRGLYLPVPLGVSAPATWTGDPWVVIHRSLAPCYIGGWSACEHWGFTDQIFRATFVFTQRRTRPRRGEIQSTPFVAKVGSADRFFGTRRVWREQIPIDISDPSKTIVDILDDPSIGGGVRHVAQIVSAYFRSEHRNEKQVVEYARRLGNRTVFKRLGYLLERLGIDAADVVTACLRNLSSGYSRLDPKGPKRGKLLRRWRLLVNVGIRAAA